jgi:hypothetical protein
MSLLGKGGRTRVSVPALTRPDESRDDLLEAVREAAGSDFEVFGEAGRLADGAVVYLARDATNKKLVMLRVRPEPDNRNNYELDVARELDASVPAPDSTCPRCNTPVRSWGRFCTQCGVDLWTDPRAGQPRSKEALLEAVQEATRGQYEILGEMPKAGGGVVYFARDLKTGKVDALRLHTEGKDTYSVGLTGVLRGLADSIANYRPPGSRNQ